MEKHQRLFLGTEPNHSNCNVRIALVVPTNTPEQFEGMLWDVAQVKVCMQSSFFGS